MKKTNKLLVSGLALSLVLSQGVSAVAAKGTNQKKSSHKVDKNKNGMDDKWEKKYKLSGKNLAKQDKDKDGLSNLIEYKLKLNPTSKDTDKDKIPDGLEDSDKDQLSNQAEINLGTNPADADSDNDKVKDGTEKDKNGVKFANKIQDLELAIVTSKKSIHFEYELKSKKFIIDIEKKSLPKGQVVSLVKQLEHSKNLTQEAALKIIQSRLGLKNGDHLEGSVKLLNGTSFELEKDFTEVSENQGTAKNDDLKGNDDHHSHNGDQGDNDDDNGDQDGNHQGDDN
ncbi:hypothetical protein [Bacillus salipaludis]|uniref:hypothetical protein n=1 Tax=Bacillus salipaludis TaxID=2547811 RepID=UPI002E1D9E87|nr:hypothetical protein [Bacillus salipaludis]